MHIAQGCVPVYSCISTSATSVARHSSSSLAVLCLAFKIHDWPSTAVLWWLLLYSLKDQCVLELYCYRCPSAVSYTVWHTDGPGKTHLKAVCEAVFRTKPDIAVTVYTFYLVWSFLFCSFRILPVNQPKGVLHLVLHLFRPLYKKLSSDILLRWQKYLIPSDHMFLFQLHLVKAYLSSQCFSTVHNDSLPLHEEGF